MTLRKSDEQNVHNGSFTAILEHWEMCSVRSVMTKIPSCRLVLEHREV